MGALTGWWACTRTGDRFHVIISDCFIVCTFGHLRRHGRLRAVSGLHYATKKINRDQNNRQNFQKQMWGQAHSELPGALMIFEDGRKHNSHTVNVTQSLLLLLARYYVPKMARSWRSLNKNSWLYKPKWMTQWKLSIVVYVPAEGRT